MAAHRLNKYLNQSYQEEESIYNIIPPEPITILKSRRYHSRYPSSIDPTGSTFGHQNTTKPRVSNLAGDFYSPDLGHQRRNRGVSFGSPPKKNQQSPSNYLRKGEGTSIGTILRLPQINQSVNKNEASFLSALNQSYVENQKCYSRNPSVPKREECPYSVVPQKKSFVLQNIVQNILSSPPKNEPQQDWLKKKNYGKIPLYLNRLKEQTQQEYETLKNFIDQEEAIKRSQVYEIPQEELQQLRSGLKERWNELNQEYQKTSHKSKLDTLSKVQKRLNLEQQLSQIEKDIELLNKKRIIVDATK
ncbi:hypothetical protein ABPG74_006929 [Tetrahymena malaccensis]